MKRIEPNLTLPLPKPGAHGPEIVGLALGLTENDVIASCSHRTKPVIQQMRAALNRTGQESDPSYDPTSVVGETYLRAMTCFSSDTGLSQIKFAPPPKRTVEQLDHTDYSVDRGVPADSYLTLLETAYGGPPADRIGPVAFDNGRMHLTLKWQFPAGSNFELDCMPRLNDGAKEDFEPALLAGIPCMTTLTVGLVLEQQPGSTTQVKSASFKLLNPRATVDAEQAYLDSVNRRYGTSFKVEFTTVLENRGRQIICTNIMSSLMKNYMKEKRDEAIEKAVDRMIEPEFREAMKALIKKGDIGDGWFNDLSSAGASLTCEAMFQALDGYQAGHPLR
jgi:hypothetical protein